LTPGKPIESIVAGIETPPTPPISTASGGGAADVELRFENMTAAAARTLAEHLFASTDKKIAGISYAIKYKLAEGHVGGDLVDVYQFDNDAVAIAVADIAGKGAQAAIHAAMIKYGLRAYASQGLSPERVLRSLDRLYLENNSFEGHDSFASVFYGLFDPSRRLFHYASAAHEPAIIVQPGEKPTPLLTTAPLIGVFDDQHHLFRQAFVGIEPGALIVAATDGVTESRNDQGELFGMERLMELICECRDLSELDVAENIMSAAENHCAGRRRDDIAVIAVRIP
jgi:sigma-B regulation protein RsbU (phosphoserine phosphatase)